jgi:hypothetical protein
MNIPMADLFGRPVEGTKILWDYMTQQVVDGGDVNCDLFDTYWLYVYRPDSSIPWALYRFPGDHMYLSEPDVPELVRLAVMVAS